MSAGRTRVARLEQAQTPLQVVRRWLATVRRYPSPQAHLVAMRDKPLALWPPGSLVGGVMAQRRTTGTGQAREAARDTAFLVYLHTELNGEVVRVVEARRAWVGWLLEQGARLWEELDGQLAAGHAWAQACRDLPYPVDRPTAAALRAAPRHRVITWEETVRR